MKTRALAVLLSLFPIFVLAQESRQPWDDYEKRIKASEGFTTSGPELFGDTVNLANGALSFSATDVSLPGNDATLPVSVSRSFSVANRKGYHYNDAPMADWDLDLPHISGVFGAGGTSYGTACTASTPIQGRPPYLSVSGGSFAPADYWNGNNAELPGGGEMLLVNPNTPKPTSGEPYYWMTPGFTYFSCLPSIKNGTGEGFLAVTKDGTRYWFDVLAQYFEPSMDKVTAKGTGAATATATLQRRRKVLYASRVEDRFGNFVNYTFANGPSMPAQLTAIDASDGRRINLTYNGQGHVTTVVANERTWTYTYSYPTPEKGTLTSVTLPDGSAWNLNLDALSSALIRYAKGEPGETYRDCLNPGDVASPGATGTITHPAGATAEFTVDPTRHGRSNVPMVCSGYTQPYNNANDDVAYYPVAYDAMSLTRKRISGPGVVAAEWNYAYTPAISFAPGTGPVCYSGDCMAPVCTADSCAGTTSTYIWGPDNGYTRYTYGNSYRYNEGKLLKVEKGTGTPFDINAPATILRTDTTAYQLAQTGQAFQTPIGTSPQERGAGFAAEYLRPERSRVVNQDGATFNWQVSNCGGVDCFDAFARPTTGVKSSSLGYSKTEATEYYDDRALWVLGQVKKGTTNGIVTVENEFYPDTALPWWSKSFGVLQHILSYYAGGNLRTVKDGAGNATGLSGWKRGVPQSIAHPATPDQPTPVLETAVVNDDGTIASVTDENGYKTCYAYDAMGRMASVTYPSESVDGACDTSTWYATTQSFTPVAATEYGLPAGHWKQVVATGNARRVTYFDGLYRPVVEEAYDAANTAATRTLTVKRYDDAGRLAFQSYPRSSLASFADAGLTGHRTAYDALDRLVRAEQDSELGVLATTTSYLNGANGPYTLVTNPRGQQTRTWFQMFDAPSYDRPVTITHPEGAITGIARDVFGKPLSIVRRNGTSSITSTRSYAYNARQQLCRVVEPETGATLSGYDAAGNLAWTAAGLPAATACDFEGDTAAILARKVVRTYDQRNRITSLAFPDAMGDTTYTYSPDSLPVTQTVANASNIVSTTYNYRRRRLLGSEVMSWNAIRYPVGYGYDRLGNLSVQSYPDGLQVRYTPNALGQPTQAGDYATGVSYHPNGAIKQFTYGNGIVHTMTQNARQLPDTSKDAYGSSTYLFDGYDYDRNGNVAAISDGLAGNRGNRTMTYDGLDRLTSVASPMYGAAGVSYSYDVLDNLTQVTAPGRTHTYCYDPAWQLTNIKVGTCATGSSVVGLGYDLQGNLQNKNGVAYTFDFGNRLRSVSGSSASSYVYDALGRRVRDYTTASKYSQYSQSGQLMFASDARTAKTSRYVYLGGSLVAISDKAHSTGVITDKYQHTDALGSPVAVTDVNRAVLERTEYEPYGKVLNRPLTDGPGYTGHVTDAATGLTYMQQRYYDSTIGRFLSVDPVTADSRVGGNFNRYWYANNNPYKFIDPDGRLGCTGSHIQSVCDRGGVAALWTSARSPMDTGDLKKLSGSNPAPNVRLREGVQLMDNFIRNDLQALSDSVGGKDVDVISGLRSQEKQDAERASGNTRAAKASQHTLGRAVDVKIKGMSQREVGKAAFNLGRFERVNVYAAPGAGVHLDYLDVGEGTQMYSDWRRVGPP